MFHFGFSYVGLIYLLMLFIPNIIWTKNKSKGYETYTVKENKILQIFEKIGEALVCVCAIIFADFNIRKTEWSIFLILSFVCMLLYEIYWIRYFRSEKGMKDFYNSILGIPVAGATLPVCAFFLLGIYGSNAFMLIAVILLGIGHIGIHLQHRNAILEKKKRALPIRIVKWLRAIIGVFLIVTITFVIGCRNVNYFNHYRLIEKGVDEGVYLDLGGQEQYVLMRGMNIENPVIIYLHGGPSSPDSYATYCFSDELVDEYTILTWDQRGCGRTYFHNIENDAENTSADFEQAKEDLDDLVDYALEHFEQDKVIILGHSYGTILGSEYVLEHPDKVSAYIAAAQVTSLEKTDIYSYEVALQKAKEAGDGITSLTNAFEKFQESKDFTDMMALRALVMRYHPVEVPDSATWVSVTSPYFGVADFRWFLKQLGDMDTYFGLNQQLFAYTFSFDAYKNSLEYEVPVYFISGTCDWVCPVDSINEYQQDITAPAVQMELLDGCGHNLQYSLPEEFSKRIKDCLNEK